MMRATPILLEDAAATGSVQSVNVGRVRTVAFRDGFDRTAIWKSPVEKIAARMYAMPIDTSMPRPTPTIAARML